jgi:antitoxin HicB
MVQSFGSYQNMAKEAMDASFMVTNSPQSKTERKRSIRAFSERYSNSWVSTKKRSSKKGDRQMLFTYPAKINEDEEGRFLVSFRDLPWGLTDGANLEEAIEEAKDCLREAVSICIDEGMEIPEPSEAEEGEVLISLSTMYSVKAAFYVAFKKSGLSKADLARRLKTNNKEIYRMLDSGHQTKIARLEEGLSVLGYRLSVSFSSAA